MAYCNNCGNKLIDNHRFCAECGQPFKPQPTKANSAPPPVIPQISTQTETAGNPQTSSGQSAGLPKQPLFKSKKAKILTVCGLTAALILAGSYYGVQQMLAPKTVANSFIKAVNEKDAQKLKKFINEGQFEMKVNDSQAETFIAYLHEHPRMISSMADGLQSEAASYEKDDSAVGAADEEGSPYASIKPNGKKWFLFDHYTVEIQTFYTKVLSDIENTEISINGKKEGTIKDGEETFGPFLPGEYTIKAVVKGDYGIVEEEQQIDSSEAEEQTAGVEFDWSKYYVSLFSNYDDAVLVVNNKATEQQIGDIDELGPVPLDGSLKVSAQKQFSSGMKKSNVVTLKKDTEEAELLIDFEEESAVETGSDTALMDMDSSFEDSSDGADESSAVEGAISEHYSSISNDDFAGAYNAFSSARKGKVTMDGWTKGLQQNLHDELNTVRVESIEGNTATAYIEMTSYDEQEDGSTLVQEWGGYWHLLKENGRWTLNEADLEKRGSRIE
ncbi:putative membrane protein YvbJ [Bacillus fengqiuensis]|nr:putative membrane protein YvbJ [Bacillus fengqiuensis]